MRRVVPVPARILVFGFLSVVTLLAVAPVVTAQDQSSEPSTVKELQQAFNVGDVHSDFVVVIDTSSSMKSGDDPLYPKVEAAYAQLVDALPEGDHLSVATFDSLPTVSFDGPITEANRGDAQRLPPADGQATDIGAALNAAVERLDRPDAAQIQTVIFITDGEPKPPVGSVFDPVGSPAWTAARDRAAGLEQQRTILVRALGLTDAGKKGAELASKVFSKTEVAQLSGDQLGDYLTGEVQKARRRVLAKAIQDEIDDNGIDAKVTPSGKLDDEVTATVDLTSTLPHLGVDLDLEQVIARGDDGSRIRSSIVGGSRTIHLEPGGKASFEILLKPNVEQAPLFSWPPPQREEVDVQLDFKQSAHATPTRLLEQELGVDTAVTVEKADAFTVGRTTGKTWRRLFFEIALLLVALIVSTWVYAKWIRRPGLTGELLLNESVEGGPSIKLRGKKMKVQGSDFGRPGRTTVRLYTRRGKKGAVYAERIGLDGSFERLVKHRWKPFEAGGSLGLGPMRLDGEGGVKIRWRRGGEEA